MSSIPKNEPAPRKPYTSITKKQDEAFSLLAKIFRMPTASEITERYANCPKKICMLMDHKKDH